MDQVQEVKNRVDIVEVISSYLTLKKAGINWKACCPFHNEKTPSMMISPERQTFKCFGCGEGGDALTFIEKMEGVDFYNALKILADKAGVQLEHHTISYGGKEHKADRKTRLFEVNDWAKKLYHKILTEHPKAEKAREYIKSRGLTQATIEQFEIGYAPLSWELLIKFLKNKGYTEEEAEGAGLAVRNERGGHYDRFRGRIVFPISNIMGNTVAFTSRILSNDDPKQPKYINSSESPIYTKGKTIYGLDKAKMAIKEKDLVILVDGNMDVIACHQAGYKNVVVTSGTALTEDQIKTLSRYAQVIAFAFDSDNAGQRAVKRAVELSVKNDISTKIIQIPFPYKDPDEAIKTNPKIWESAIKEAKPSIEYWIDLAVKNNPELTVIDKKKIAKEILPVIKMVASEIEKECYIKYLSGRLLISEKSLFAVLDKTKSDKPKEEKEEKAPVPKMTLEEKIVGILWLSPELLQRADKIDLPDIAKYGQFAEMVREKSINREKLTPETILALDQLALTIFEEYNTQDPDLLFAELQFILGRQKSDKREAIREKYAARIKQAEEVGDKEELKRLLLEFANLIK